MCHFKNPKTKSPLYTITPVSRTDGVTLGLWKGPCRVVIFCTLSVIFPALLISLPLLMRFIVCGSSTYFLSASDMMILDHRISTTWCQTEVVTMNASFTAYITDGEPTLSQSPEPLIFAKTLLIPDDHKEYWGFYLLKGSTFSLSTCSKFKGASVLVVQGRSHLHDCAYIGNTDSAGHSDEHSDSRSLEEERLSPGSVRRISNTTASHEEMSKILVQIRSYIKTHPRGYGHLQRNLFGIFKSNETEHAQRRRRSIPNEPEIGKVYGRHVSPRFAPGADGAFEEDVDYTGDAENRTKEDDTPVTTSSIWNQHHTGILNYSTPDDGSDSESESSFSSSEEALARCKGIIGIFYLNRTEDCGGISGDFNFHFNSTITESGFYYFIFGSENEKTTNLLQIHLAIERVEYELPIPLQNCTNVRKCEVPFRFASNEKFVVSIPTAQEETWDEVIYAETDCVPRTSIYLIFVLMVPLVILIFAFQ